MIQIGAATIQTLNELTSPSKGFPFDLNVALKFIKERILHKIESPNAETVKQLEILAINLIKLRFRIESKKYTDFEFNIETRVMSVYDVQLGLYIHFTLL